MRNGGIFLSVAAMVALAFMGGSAAAKRTNTRAKLSRIRWPRPRSRRPVRLDASKIIPRPYGVILNYKSFDKLMQVFRKPTDRNNPLGGYAFVAGFRGRAKVDLIATQKTWDAMMKLAPGVKPEFTASDAEASLIMTVGNMGMSAPTSWIRDFLSTCLSQAISSRSARGTFRISAKGAAAVSHSGADKIGIEIAANNTSVAKLKCSFIPSQTSRR